MKIIFDFGIKASYNIWGDLSSKLKFVDENGEEIKFNSMVDAANYMVDKGWNFQQAYSSAYGGKPVILEKPRDFDPFGHAGLSPLVTI